ncbi:omptin family outer membrane protease [Deminuibacter soli]|uniref:Omptin family outer membrane protease n=1 Tax=Deminuibacter soli TaxID=2291815 RepID=A0A3E1NHW5_9BACT|nr:omptin family outer membrane protease [Deminuibacter soli]RFM27358.1 omptin family outer membrane protease [Deminuibacter soli]
MKLTSTALFVCMLFVALPLSLCAQTTAVNEVSIYSGYGQGNFRWSIAGNTHGQSPNIYSELKWHAIGGAVLGAHVHYEVWPKWLLEADFNQVFLSTGKVSDRDYAGDNRTQNIYDGHFSGADGHLRSFSGGVGYRLIQRRGWELQPFIGYTNTQQQLSLTDPGGVYSQLHSTYQTSWQGGYVKAKALVQLSKLFQLKAGAALRVMAYDAKADWNLINTFSHPISFKDAATGLGADIDAQLSLAVTRSLHVFAGAGWYYWKTGNGTDELYLADGSMSTTQFNEAVRQGWQLNLGCAFHW